jgi:hypothetical protein
VGARTHRAEDDRVVLGVVRELVAVDDQPIRPGVRVDAGASGWPTSLFASNQLSLIVLAPSLLAKIPIWFPR